MMITQRKLSFGYEGGIVDCNKPNGDPAFYTNIANQAMLASAAKAPVYESQNGGMRKKSVPQSAHLVNGDRLAPITSRMKKTGGITKGSCPNSRGFQLAKQIMDPHFVEYQTPEKGFLNGGALTPTNEIIDLDGNTVILSNLY